MSYWCYNCSRKFDDTNEKTTTKARLFGVDEMPNDEQITIELCPYCKSDEITEEDEDEE